MAGCPKGYVYRMCQGGNFPFIALQRLRTWVVSGALCVRELVFIATSVKTMRKMLTEAL